MAFHYRKQTEAAATMMHSRLLKDIDELQRGPYPGIELHINEADVTARGLCTFAWGSALMPPDVTIQSSISHPNIFGDRICLNMLVIDDDVSYTPAYTLKGICIQLLCFFASETIKQMWGENGGKG
ncbi:hypothetical protein CERZMDRAFT_105592 [Cercospora zeae-maydis SCOH1-5]|uniref:Uncharacterized protein n=1 Tax=Cercospora zeae-maydis SCOH1-5 TaxID=717836 RepID=A0A6A6FKX3_9PEZI|nr:hypothetical protein CERZMDRAFT_105592 [Cercospora zeae-maydis SCOH1-5]